MPVTAKLSKDFYDKVGERAADELVNWMNGVHETSRAELRELNELNFARFDAKLEQRFAEFRAEMAQMFVQSEARIEARIKPQLDAKLDTAVFEARMAAFSAQMDARFERVQKDMIRLMFFAWMTLLIPIIGLWMRG